MQPSHPNGDLTGPQNKDDAPANDVPVDVKYATDPIVVESGEGIGDEKVDILHAPADTADVLVHAIHLHDDPSMPAITFRSMFLGVGLSVFGGVLSGIYYFKPQTVTLPTVFLAVIAFLLGEAMSLGIPRRGRFGKFLNPHPFK